MDRPAGGAVPQDGGLALIGDTDRGDIGGADARLGHGGANSRDGRVPDLFRVVLNETWSGIDLAKLLLRGRDRNQRAVEQDGAGRRGALIDRKEMVGHGFSSSVPRRSIRGDSLTGRK